MRLYAVIDLHSNNNVLVLVILDERDRIVYERRLPNELPFILAQLAPYLEKVVERANRRVGTPGPSAPLPEPASSAAVASAARGKALAPLIDAMQSRRPLKTEREQR